ncbi:hypothetical protein PR202_gb03694 [Eleusine coracana subsp. coracana]|uniref:[RNA-polymerase]-subunit kinase n=1 Tax=Eleusine coracana subsp. coracana TaxID=191504 RepID=A0AAV5E2J1_ELECO|nr:hypothetical protein PR202_gb03694 [Eleusine coracana subsp. coracana]
MLLKIVDGNKYKGSIYMVFEYMDHDLTGLADRPGMRFTVPQIKCYMRQLLTGLHYCHVNQVLHRDIKGSNLLIDNEGNLKLADFGLARSFSSDHNGNLTNRVITLWYRPPELLLGSTKYGPAVDMWSVGCIFAELLNGKPILPGKNEPEQLTKIFELCGTPDDLIWPGVTKMPWYNNFKPPRPLKRRVKEFFKHFDRHALDLLEKMLTLDPSQRISAKDALDAEYFWTDPLPCDPKRYNLMGSHFIVPQLVSSAIVYLVDFELFALSACQSTKHHMNSRLRKNVSNRGKQRRLQSVKKSSTLLHILVCLQSSSQGRHTQSGPARVCTMHHPWGLAQAITMQSLEGQEDLIGTHRVGIKVEATIRTVAEDRVVATGVVHIHSKDEDLRLTLVEVHVVVVAVVMEVAGQISHKVARMAHLVRAEDQTIVKVVLAISNSMVTGNNRASNITALKCCFSWTMYLQCL